jgi:hypothetical protein
MRAMAMTTTVLTVRRKRLLQRKKFKKKKKYFAKQRNTLDFEPLLSMLVHVDTSLSTLAKHHGTEAQIQQLRMCVAFNSADKCAIRALEYGTSAGAKESRTHT